MVVVYGDASRRVTLVLPRSLAALQRRCEAEFGFACRLYVDKHAAPGVNSASSTEIRNEADFAYIVDDDVVIATDPNGARIDLNKFFDELTTYKRDYVAYAPNPRARLRDTVNLKDVGPPPDLSALIYKTTYNATFTPKRAHRDADFEPNVPAWRTSQTGTTTYLTDYVPQAMDAREFVDPAPRVDPRWHGDYKSTYKKDFTGGYAASAHAFKREPEPLDLGYDGCDWKPTEYRDEYVEKAPKHFNYDIHAAPEDLPEGEHRPVPWVSTHDAHYVPHEVRVGHIHADPEVSLASRFS